MCGRIVQKSSPLDYVERIFSGLGKAFADSTGPRYNIPPGTRPLAIHSQVHLEVDLAHLPWGYKPHGSRFFMVNAKLETIRRDGWPWKLLIGSGRILVPADGWYEWKPLTDEPKPTKQPYYIHSTKPLFFAALSAWRPGDDLDQAHGFAIVTNDALGGMVDVHDRRPVALPEDVAKRWLDHDLNRADAVELLLQGLPETDFTWHPVRTEVGNSKYQLPDAIEPI